MDSALSRVSPRRFEIRKKERNCSLKNGLLRQQYAAAVFKEEENVSKGTGVNIKESERVLELKK